MHYLGNFKNKSIWFQCDSRFTVKMLKSKPQNLTLLINAGCENETVFYFPLLSVYHWMETQSMEEAQCWLNGPMPNLNIRAFQEKTKATK